MDLSINERKDMIIDQSYLRILEAILFVSDEPLTVEQMAQAMRIEEREVEAILQKIKEKYTIDHSGFYLREIAGGYQFFATDEATPYLENLFQPRFQKLSQAALETLAIIAYKQPVTRGEVELIRGVSCDGPMRSLQERQLIEECGRKEAPGRPILFTTTKKFLTTFGLNDLADLPDPEWQDGVENSILDVKQEEF